MIKKYKIPTIIGIVVLILGVFAGVFLLRTTQVFRIGASTTATPKNIRTSNITDSSVTISWITDALTAGFINWGVTQGNLNKIENETENDQKFYTHSITLTGLKADTVYFYKINSNGTSYDNNGIPWQITTGDQLTLSQNSNPISGSVISTSGTPAKRALVYVNVNGYLLSTLTSDSGNFVLQLGSVRSPDLKSYAQIDNAQTLLDVSVEAENGNTSSAQIYPQSANPMPPLVFGQVQDYRSLQPVAASQNPNASLNLPSNTTQASKFDTSAPAGATTSTSVILESVNEGEVVTSNQPQFFGKGPGGETIDVTIHSDQLISGTVQIPKNGSWSYSPSIPLSDGSHSITISWKDASGILRTLTRDFVVQAGEMPAFTASGSGSTSSPTPTPTATPKITPTPVPSPTNISSPSASPVPVPVTGDMVPTLLLSIIGIVILAFSFGVWKFSDLA